MTLTMQIKLLPTPEQQKILDATTREYVSLINDINDYAIALGYMPKLSSKDIKAPLPSALRDQCRLDARSIYTNACKPKKQTRKSKSKKHRLKKPAFPVLRKPVAIWNNQNYKVQEGCIVIPVWIDGKTRQIKVAAATTPEILITLTANKKGTLRITQKSGKYIAQVAYELPPQTPSGDGYMGVDIGIKCPAVCRTNTGKTKFCGKGRQNRYTRRRHNSHRKKKGKAKKLDAIRKSKNKEQRYMRDQDHKVSRSIVNFAQENNVKVIRLEHLAGIRVSARTSRKNKHELHTWSFYRLASYIGYKAMLAGIEVEYVDPAYTSQTCPVCGARNKAKDRTYTCKNCGYHNHRDIVGAIGVLNGTPVSPD